MRASFLVLFLTLLFSCNSVAPTDKTLAEILPGIWKQNKTVIEFFNHGGVEYKAPDHSIRKGVWAVEGDTLMLGKKTDTGPWDKKFYKVLNYSREEFNYHLLEDDSEILTAKRYRP